ncbi:DUF6443 domain-containing protein [Chryseobacterium sp.]|uniref:DUF6443 domain-containing protein n=1 Tax=Chryseobacterium sp. TaxID=1871047 RepID=UPI000ED16AA5|nr:DUF6443 domain-containing protein [Chryseobacterium sp.]HCM34218.1 sugar-binding protein [Chryseobacterium sp.]
MKKYLTAKSLAILGLIVSGVSHAQSTNENYVQSTACIDDNCSKKVETITYYDGLGRPKQIIGVKVTPTGKDLVTPITYDGYGRKVMDILPVPVPTQNKMIHSGITDENPANTYYGVGNAYAEKELEKSPLGRILQQGQAGDAWKLGGGHTATYKYEVNTGNEVKKFGTTTIPNTVGGISNTVSELFVAAGSGFYDAGSLYKNTVSDEDGIPVIRFENDRGQTLLIRRTDGTQNIDTYYVYNEYNQKAFVIPAKAIQQIEQNNNVITKPILDELCYQYRYDGQDREVEKKLPGKDWEFTVYDKQDRVVLTQDGPLRVGVNNFNGKGWIFTKYDELGRIAYTGFFSNTATRQVMQNAINSMSSNPYNNESRSTDFFSLQGINVYYNKKAFPTGSMTLLTVNYYDTYPLEAPAVPSTILGQYTLPQGLSDTDNISTNGLLTATYVKNIEDNNWTKTYSYYDTTGQLISTKTTNHLGGYTNRELKLDYTGQVKESYTYHKKSVPDTEVVIKERFIYDDQQRLLKQYHQVDTKPEELLAENFYNEIGELINKKTGNTTGVPLQSIDQTYNIRGWLTKVNDPGNLNGKLFAYEVKYHNPAYSNVSPAKYNGNIAEIDWASANDGKLKRYNYQYDALNRLKNGIYAEPNTTVPRNNSFNESISYDLNGNIIKLKRSRFVDGVGVQLMDDLSYAYTGNRLNMVTDASGNHMGYPDLSGNPISYDSNGNMTNHIDKGMLQIDYNYLNLPNYIKFEKEYVTHDMQGLSNINTRYLYNAAGSKLRKTYTYGTGRTNMETTSTTDYLGDFQYTRDDLSFVPTSEGYYDFKQNKYIYNYTDQVGNVRLAYYKGANGEVVIDRTTDYYPFGLEFGGDLSTANSLTPDYRYSSQGQEQQTETGWSSYKWRNYDSTLGRFFNVDPLAEDYNTWSTYTFSGNRVVDARELEGLEPLEIKKTTQNLIIVNQGYVGTPLPGNTQAQNYAKYNKDGGIDYEGIGIINNLNSSKNQVGVFASGKGDVTKNDILASVQSFRKQSPNGKLIMVGHSMGADNLIEMINEHSEVKVDLLFTLDIADDPLSGTDDDIIPSNVKTAVNYYNKNDGFLHSGIGGEDIEAKDPSKTKVLNVPVSSAHTQIDNKYRYNAYNAVVNELNKKEKK